MQEIKEEERQLEVVVVQQVRGRGQCGVDGVAELGDAPVRVVGTPGDDLQENFPGRPTRRGCVADGVVGHRDPLISR